MERYHIRRTDLAIESEEKMLEVIEGQDFMTLAMCKDDRPYLITVNYTFDPDHRCFYFHCASTGKKIDILGANPFVWGQVVEDLGYVEGECEYGYRSVMFEGKVTFVDDLAEKRKALESMISSFEDEPEKAKQRLITQEALEKVSIVRVEVLGMTGKESIPQKK